MDERNRISPAPRQVYISMNRNNPLQVEDPPGDSNYVVTGVALAALRDERQLLLAEEVAGAASPYPRAREAVELVGVLVGESTVDRALQSCGTLMTLAPCSVVLPYAGGPPAL